MKIMLADDEAYALKDLKEAVKKAAPDAEIYSYSNITEALNDIDEKGYLFDVAFLDVSMPEMNGIQFARKLQERKPNVNIIFVTAYDQFAIDALKIHASGYLLKPVKDEEVKAELGRLRHPVLSME